MAKRKDLIWNYLQQKKATQQGFTTSELAEQLNMQRSNVSKELNELVRQQKLTKSDGRPVTYFLVEKALDQLVDPIPPVEKYVPSYKELPVTKPRLSFEKSQDVFQTIIGINGSMKNAGEQAKAAILYPPKGLNCLITGPTGSGKTHFAHAMFQFARQNEVIASDKELIVFNCADYAHNPELLMSHLFGYAKGAFTGAEKDKEGIIEEANDGMLFLDEIHRLPPEGQEMIFYFMDHGRYNRLGESGKHRQASVRIIGATTENPSSTLLGTFLRRIPITIQLPSFDERPAIEKIDLVKVMVAQEAKRIERTISLTEDVVKSLIGAVTFGNIGQLKSNVQLICARGFLNHMYHNEIEITMEDVPEGIRSGLVHLASKRQSLTALSQYVTSKLVIQPDDALIDIQTGSYDLPYNLYDIIGDKADLLKAEGVDQETIHHFISTDINVHLKSFYKNHGFSFQSENKLSEFVDPKIIELTNQLYQIVHERFGDALEQNFLYAMSLHISSFMKKIQLGDIRYSNDNIREMVHSYPEELALAHEIRQHIAHFFQVEIPQAEEDYLAVLLISLRNASMTGKIGVVVAAHGESTARSMVDVVKSLLGVDQIAAVDMPLDMSPKVAYDKVVEAVKRVHDYSGVLLMVDMGSLATFQDQIQRDTGIKVRTLDMVTTPNVLEAARKASVIGSDLDSIYDALRTFRGYGHVAEKAKDTNKERVILAICASGEGTAQQVKKIIETSLGQQHIDDLNVLTLSVVELSTRLADLVERYEIIASTGVVDPKIDAPFISLERFINADTDELIDYLLMESTFEAQLLDEDRMIDQVSAKQACQRFMAEGLTFFNPDKLIDPLWTFASQLLEVWKIQDETYAFRTNLVTHCSNLFERALLKRPLSATSEQIQAMYTFSGYAFLHRELVKLMTPFGLDIAESEEYYIVEMLRLKIDTQ